MYVRALFLLPFLAVISGFRLSAQAPLTPVVGPPVPQVVYSTIAFGDYNSDGLKDLFLAGMNSSGTPETYLLRNDTASKTFDTISVSFPKYLSADASWGDLNGDGNLDIAMMGATGSKSAATRIFLQDSSGNFASANHPIPDLRNGTIDFVDLDGDNDPDLVATGWNFKTGFYVGVFRNDGGSLSDFTPAIMEGRFDGAIDFGDYDNDWDLDIAFGGTDADGYGRLDIYRQTAPWNWEETNYQLPGIQNGTLDFGDMDSDGDLDLMVTGATSEELIILEYSPDFFSVKATGLPMVQNGSAEWGDFDQDNDLDILLTGFRPDQNWYSMVFEKGSSGSYSANVSSIIDLGYSNARWADLDSDGDLDFLIAGQTANDNVLSLLYYFNGTVFEY